MSRDDTDSEPVGYIHEAGGGAGDTEDDQPAGGFGARGWVLVAVVVLATIGIPGFIYLYAANVTEVGVPFLVAMLALPMVPALLLGLTAVWSMTAATSDATGDRGED